MHFIWRLQLKRLPYFMICFVIFSSCFFVSCGKAEIPKIVYDCREVIKIYNELISNVNTGYYLKKYVEDPEKYSGFTLDYLKADKSYGELYAFDHDIESSTENLFKLYPHVYYLFEVFYFVFMPEIDYKDSTYKDAKPLINHRIEWIKSKTLLLEQLLINAGYSK